MGISFLNVNGIYCWIITLKSPRRECVCTSDDIWSRHRHIWQNPLYLQVRTLFLQWIPWVLRMARPGEKITRKTIMMQNKMKELDLKEKSSKSLLANVLDMDDDFVPSSQLPHSHIHQVCSLE